MREVKDIISDYVHSAIEQEKTFETGNFKKGNKYHDIIRNCFEELKNLGEGSILELLKLLDHNNMTVAGWAAYHLLPYKPLEAISTLERLAAQGSFDAKMTLKEWRNGTLQF